MPERVTSTRLVLVEGKDEVNFFSAVCQEMALADVDIRSFEGVANLRPLLRALRNVEGFAAVTRLGIIRDAEGNGHGAFASVTGGLQAAELPVPAAPLTLTLGTPRVVVLINPHGEPDGRFDDVCLRSVADAPEMVCVQRYLDCLAALAPGIPQRPWKTRIHTFIAAQARPEVSLGVAAKCGYFPLDHAAFAHVRTLFQMVCGD